MKKLLLISLFLICSLASATSMMPVDGGLDNYQFTCAPPPNSSLPAERLTETDEYGRLYKQGTFPTCAIVAMVNSNMILNGKNETVPGGAAYREQYFNYIRECVDTESGGRIDINRGATIPYTKKFGLLKRCKKSYESANGRQIKSFDNYTLLNIGLSFNRCSKINEANESDNKAQKKELGDPVLVGIANLKHASTPLHAHAATLVKCTKDENGHYELTILDPHRPGTTEVLQVNSHGEVTDILGDAGSRNFQEGSKVLWTMFEN